MEQQFAVYCGLTVFCIIFHRFSPADTNLVLREFEKCGVILKHVPGPRNANWMHILYQVIYAYLKLTLVPFFACLFSDSISVCLYI